MSVAEPQILGALRFTVHGIPAPQGSKGPFGNESNPRTRPWRAAVAQAAADMMGGAALLDGPLCLSVRFMFPRPRAHHVGGKYANPLRPDAPVWHSHRPDLDKLVRAIGDSLTGVAVRDDSQFAVLNVSKLYGSSAMCVVTIEEAL